jgi:hypothetical protein
MANGDRLSDSATDAVSDDARALDAQLVEELDDPLGVRTNVDAASQRPIASPVSEKIDDDESMARRHERNDVAPQVSRRREAVQKDDGVSGASRSRGVVVNARAGEVEEFTAHNARCVAWGAGRCPRVIGDAREKSNGPSRWRRPF